MRKRTYTAEEKVRIVLEVLQGEKELNQVASDNEIAPNQIRRWKSEFIEKAPLIFDVKRDSKLKAEIIHKESEIDAAYKKVGQLTAKVDWLEKKSAQVLGSEWASQFTPYPK